MSVLVGSSEIADGLTNETVGTVVVLNLLVVGIDQVGSFSSSIG